MIVKEYDIKSEVPFSDADLTNRIIKVEGSTDPVGAFHCTGGFGCLPSGGTRAGGKVMGRFIASGEETFVRRDWATGFATEAEISKANEWAKRPSWDINPVIADKIASITNSKVMEVARDESKRTSKDQLRAVLLDTYCALGEVLTLLKEVSEDAKQPSLEGTNGHQAE